MMPIPSKYKSIVDEPQTFVDVFSIEHARRIAAIARLTNMTVAQSRKFVQLMNLNFGDFTFYLEKDSDGYYEIDVKERENESH